MTTTNKLKLSAHLAIDARRRKEAHENITKLHRETQNTAVMTGINRVYQPVTDGGQKLPPESKKVQLRSDDALEQVGEALASLINTTGTKDLTNTVAKADVVLDDKVLIKDAPPVFLLFLEKELRDLRTFVEKMLELDPALDWTLDPNDGIYRSATVETAKTAKIEDTVVVVQATDKHPAQTKTVTIDKVVGHWSTTQLSGGIPRSEKEKILRRITRVEEAVKTARERANLTEVIPFEGGQDLVNYIFPRSTRAKG